MTLYLLSSWASNPTFLTTLGVMGKTILWINTATRGEGRDTNPDDLALVHAFGAKTDVVDLRDFDTPTLAKKIASADIVWIAGGNTYVLLHALRTSGFDALLNAHKDRLVVVGESAGAVVFGRDIGHVSCIDDPSLAPVQDTTGLGWVDITLVPHWQETKYGMGKVLARWAQTQDMSRYTLLHETAYFEITQTGSFMVDQHGHRVLFANF